MTIRIRNTELSAERLPALVTDTLDELLGEKCRVLDASPPWADAAIFAVDGEGKPTLVQYDVHDGGRALLSGLATLDKLKTELHWLTRSYPEFSKGQPLVLPALVTVSPTRPPGAALLCAKNAWLHCFTFRALQVNAETGLLFESVTATDSHTEPTSAVQPAQAVPPSVTSEIESPMPAPSVMDDSVLSPEEEAFFRHL